MRDVLPQNLDENNNIQTSTDRCTTSSTVNSSVWYWCVCVCYIQFAGDTSVYICCTVMSKQTLYDYLLQMMIPLLLCRQQGEEATKRHTACGTAAKRICLPRSVDAVARLPNKHNNRPRCLDRPRCLREVNSGIHAPHPLDLRGVIKPPKPPILLNFEHLKHRGPCRQRPLSSLK